MLPFLKAYKVCASDYDLERFDYEYSCGATKAYAHYAQLHTCEIYRLVSYKAGDLVFKHYLGEEYVDLNLEDNNTNTLASYLRSCNGIYRNPEGDRLVALCYDRKRPHHLINFIDKTIEVGTGDLNGAGYPTVLIRKKNGIWQHVYPENLINLD